TLLAGTFGSVDRPQSAKSPVASIREPSSRRSRLTPHQRRFRIAHGNTELNDRSSSRTVLCPDITAVRFNDRPANRQTQAGAANVICAATEEFLENAVFVTGFESRTRIPDLNLHNLTLL